MKLRSTEPSHLLGDLSIGLAPFAETEELSGGEYLISVALLNIAVELKAIRQALEDMEQGRHSGRVSSPVR